MGFKVLAVDDELDTLELLKTIFEAEGAEVKTLSDGSKCYETAKEYQPDVILLDIMMPLMNGWVVFLNLQKDDATKKIPILILSAKPLTDESREKVHQLGVVDYIMKPFEVDEITQKVKGCLSRS
jgi:DNA-binding response OmpR family regulator